eukprot:3864425-Amphidinium_carterae.4
MAAWKPVLELTALDTAKKTSARVDGRSRERRQVELPADDAIVLACVKLHGLLPAPRVSPVIPHELALVYRAGARTFWIDGSDHHSSDPQRNHCGVGYYTDTQETAWLPLPVIKQSVYRAEFLAVALP